MARGNTQAQAGATAGLNQSGALFNQAGALYGGLAPQLQAESINPSGFNPTTMARMKTENEQAGGGANAGVTGEAGLIEGRTRNAGGTGAALSQAARTTGAGVTDANLKTNLANEQLKEEQRQAGLSGQENLYGAGLRGGEAALGDVAPNVNANTEAVNSSWDWAKDLFAPFVGAAGGAAPSIQQAFA